MSFDGRANKVEVLDHLISEDVSTRPQHSSISKSERKRTFLQRRHIVAIFMFFGTMNMYSLRTNISVAIVDMTANKTFWENGSAIIKKEFDWNSKDQGYILGSAYFGQFMFSIIGGWLGSKFGGVQMFGLGLLVASVLTMLTPIVNTQQIYPMIIMRLLEGALQGMIFASTSEIWGQWFPAKERARLVATSLAGAYFGLAVCYAISGFLAKHCGWQSIFYTTGGAGVTWSILWFAFVRECPESDPWISETELEYLKADLKHEAKRKIEYPWIEIFTSRPVIAIAVRKLTHGFGSLFLKTVMPLFANDVLHYNIQNVGFISSLAILFTLIGLSSCAILKDFAQNQSFMDATTVSKVLTFASAICSYMILVSLGFSTTELPIIVCLLLYPFFDAFSIFVLYMNPVEISPEYASIISGIGAMLYTFAHILGPIFIGFIVVAQEAAQWRIVISGIVAIELCGLLVYVAWASSEVQQFSTKRSSPNSSAQPTSITL